MWVESMPSPETRRSSTIFIVNPQRDDACGELARTLQTEMITSNSSLPVITDSFPNHDPEVWIPSHLDKAGSAYFVASIRTSQDLTSFTSAVDLIRRRTGVEDVTAVFTHLPCTREDKRKVQMLQQRHAGPYPSIEMENVVMLQEVLKHIRGLVTRGYVVQAHSPKTHEYAAEIGIPLVPLTPCREVLAYLKRIGVHMDSENHRIACPDKGEELMDSIIRDEIEQLWGFQIPKVRFDKTRHLDGRVEFARLSPEDQKLVEGKVVWMFDDVGSTFQTGGRISRILMEHGVRGVNMVCMYADLVDDWKEYIDHPVIWNVFYGNSQVPFGDETTVKTCIRTGKITPVPLGGFIERVVAADAVGLNPFDHPDISRAILMPKDGRQARAVSDLDFVRQSRMSGF